MSDCEIANALTALFERLGHEFTCDECVALDCAVNHYRAQDEAGMLDAEQPD